MLDISELFSAVALYAFQRLLVVYVDSLTPSYSFSELKKQSSNWKLQKSLQSVPGLLRVRGGKIKTWKTVMFFLGVLPENC